MKVKLLLIRHSSFVIRNCRLVALTLFLSAQCFISDAHAAEPNNDIQYLGVHKTDSATANDNRWSVFYPDSFNQAGMDEILNAVGTKGRTNRRLAVSYTFSYLDHDESHPLSRTVESLKNMLKLAVDNDVPVIIHLDGVNAWGRRSDLWNWWDQSIPNYNPKNSDNVEHYDWGMSTGTAVKIGWRNWRTPVNPLRVKPHPNLASKAFRDAQIEALNVVLPVIAEWYNKLPSDKKYLLGGVVFGWELSPYLQAYYLPNGNDYLDTNAYPPANDPFPVFSAGGNVMALGYGAAQTLGLQKEGGLITRETIDAICLDYLKFLINIAIGHGIEPKKIITHTIPGFTTIGGAGGHSGRASIVDIEGVIAGWTADRGFKTFGSLYNALEGRPWAVIETAYTNVDADLFKEIFAHRNNRYINVFNWESIKGSTSATSALREVLMELGGSVSVGAQTGGLTAGTAGAATFPVTTTEIISGAAITLNNINSVAGITLGTAVTAGDKTALVIATADATPQGVHTLTLTIDGLTSNSFSLIVVNKVSPNDVKYYPNPLQPSKGPNYSKMQFSNIPPETRIKIYTMLGQEVRELKADVSGTAVWDGKNKTGEKAASGVYIVYMEDGAGNKKRIKIAVER